MTTVRELDLPDDLARIEALYAETRDGQASRERFAWAYLENPAGKARVWGAEDGGRLVGMAAVFPRRLRVAPALDVAAWTTGDLSVAPSHRRQGLARTLREEARRAVDRGDAALLFAMPNPQAARVHDRAGFTPLGHMQRMIRPVSLPGPPLVRRATARILDAMLRPARGAAGELRLLSPGATLDDLQELQDLYDRVSPSLGASLVRSAAYVDWRYLRNPKAATRLLVVRREGRVAGFAALVARGRSLYLRDWLADGPDVLRGLVAEATRLATGEGRAWLSASALESHRDLAVLRSAGFRPRGAGTAVTVYARATEPWAASVLSPAGWYLTGGDPDI